MPITGWPDKYSSWVVDILGEIHVARKKREAGEVERLRKSASKPGKRRAG